MSRPIAPGQTTYVPFVLAETPDSTPTIEVYLVQAGTIQDTTSEVNPSVTDLGLLVATDHNEWLVGFTPLVNSIHGDAYLIRVLVTIGGETTAHWLDGGCVELWASQASVDAVAASIAGLSGTEVVTVSPVGTDGEVTVYRNRDYTNDDGLALEWSNSAGTWPDLTEATIHVRVGIPGCSTTALYQFTGTAPTPSGSNQTVRLELTAADVSIRPDDYTYNVVATLASGNIVQLYAGSWAVLFALDAPD